MLFVQTNGILERAVSKSKTTAKVSAARPVAKKPTAKVTAKTTAKVTAKKPTAKTTAKKLPAATKPVATKAPAACPLYLEADRLDISRRELGELEKRANEEFWFRWEDPNIVKGTNILQLATRPGAKVCIYLNISESCRLTSPPPPYVLRTLMTRHTNGSQLMHPRSHEVVRHDFFSSFEGVNKSSTQPTAFSGRVPTIYVLPSGTRDKLLKQAKNFEQTSEAKKRVDFVTKDNEPGDIGIQGVSAAAEGEQIPLDQFRALIKRIVVKVVATKAKNKAT